jgi:DNA-3-methyladenine glycosylase
MHWLLNVVTEAENFPAAVLIRAVQPHEGFEVIATRRKGQPESQWTNGPGKLCQAFGIDGALNTADLLAPHAELIIEQGTSIPDDLVLTGPRVGINSVPEPWKSIPWRFRTEIDIRNLNNT